MAFNIRPFFTSGGIPFIEKRKPVIWKDPKTGLEWQYEAPGEMDWYEALEYAKSITLDHKGGWRLPGVKELESLLDRSRYRPVMRNEIPFRDTLSYWSSTTFAPNTKNAWIIMFDGAYILSYSKKNKYYVRCVRG
ncbi:MAG: DUF1566 domain-containing protein [Deltaproteobacteria bacterium]|nr:DUF1566 domain-containing protein [Deltaproteobacteria bacterium]